MLVRPADGHVALPHRLRPIYGFWGAVPRRASIAAAVGRTLCVNGPYPDMRKFERIPNFYDEAFDAIVLAVRDPALLPAIGSTAATDTKAVWNILQHGSNAKVTPEAYKTILWRPFREVLLKVAGVTSGHDAVVTKKGICGASTQRCNRRRPVRGVCWSGDAVYSKGKGEGMGTGLRLLRQGLMEG